MPDRIALRLMQCPKCHSKHIDAFANPFWYLCRDCGYNSPAVADETTAISKFCKGVVDDDPR
jgi:ribosomal protein L37AE/L43A